MFAMQESLAGMATTEMPTEGVKDMKAGAMPRRRTGEDTTAPHLCTEEKTGQHRRLMTAGKWHDKFLLLCNDFWV